MHQPGNQPLSRSVRLIRATVIAIIMILVGASLGYCSEPNCGDTWSKDIYRAVQESRQNDQVIMLLFSRTDTCIYCKKLEQEITNTSEFCNWSRDFVKFKVDFSEDPSRSASLTKQNSILKRKFADLVTSYPTVLFVDGNGSVLAKTGYISGGVNQWIAQTDALVPQLKKNKLSRQNKVVASPVAVGSNQ